MDDLTVLSNQNDPSRALKQLVTLGRRGSQRNPSAQQPQLLHPFIRWKWHRPNAGIGGCRRFCRATRQLPSPISTIFLEAGAVLRDLFTAVAGYSPPMASAELSRRVEKVVGYRPLSQMDADQRSEFHEALLDAEAFEDLPGKWQAAVVAAEQNRSELRIVGS